MTEKLDTFGRFHII